MVKIYTEVYNLKLLNSSRNGKLFKNENVYNLIMSFMFKKTKIKVFIRSMIRANEEQKIKKLGEKIKNLHKKGVQYF